MSNRNEIWHSIEIELRKAKKIYPNWPDHAAARAGIVTKESGMLMRSCLELKYDKSPDEVVKETQISRIKDDAVKTAVAAIRFLENFNCEP